MGGKGKGKKSGEDSDYEEESGSGMGSRTIYVGNLAWSVAWQDLKDFFNEIGPVEHAECLEYADGRKTGSGIVRFKSEEDAKKAIKECHDADFHGRPMLVREDRENGKGPGSKGYGKKGKGKEKLPWEMAERQLYVGNLSYYTSWQTLKDHMAWCGEVEFCDVMIDASGEKLGYGLVRYKTSKDAKKAIKEINDTELDGRWIFVREDKDGFKIAGSNSEVKGKGKKGKKGEGKRDRKGSDVSAGSAKKGKGKKGKKGKGKGDDSDDDDEDDE